MISLSELKYRNLESDFVYLENWMEFGIELANYVKKINHPIKIYISVRSNLLFSYFFVFGAIDYDFRNPSKETLMGKYLGLKKGQRILYKTGEEWVAHSVIEVSKTPDLETRAIVVKERSKDCIKYIPETRWFDYVRVYDNEVTKLKNTRRVNNVESISDNIKLKSLYSEHSLNLLMMQNTPQTYLCANKKEWIDNISIIEFKVNEEFVQLKELLFDGTEGIFENFSFTQQKTSSSFPNESTIIFLGSSRAYSKMDHFKQQKCIFIVDQQDSSEKIEELQQKIEQEFLMEKGQSLNKDILEYMNNNQIRIPKGVELFAWLSKG